MSKKRGKLHNDELNFIRRNVIEMSDEEIAKHLNRSVEVVRKTITEESLRPLDTDEDRATRARLKQELHQRQYWPILQQQFTPEELLYFEGSWIKAQMQFREDILPTEELQLKQYITTMIGMDRTMIERRNNTKDADRLQELLDIEYKKPTEDRDTHLMASLSTQIAAARAAVTAYTTEFVKLSDYSKSLQKELRASRADRVKRIEDSKTSWNGLLRLLEDEDKRIEIGEEAELFKIAVKNRAQKLAELHEFEDGKVDQPLLDVEFLHDENADFSREENKEHPADETGDSGIPGLIGVIGEDEFDGGCISG